VWVTSQKMKKIAHDTVAVGFSYVLKVLDVKSQDGGNQSGEAQTQPGCWLWTMAFLELNR
jgi:hypothetical protein